MLVNKDDYTFLYEAVIQKLSKQLFLHVIIAIQQTGGRGGKWGEGRGMFSSASHVSKHHDTVFSITVSWLLGSARRTRQTARK